jgi:hypothetical protein
MTHSKVQIPVGEYVRLLLVVIALLVVIHCGLNYYTYSVSEVPWLLYQLFELDEENNVPTWFSSFLLLNNAIVTLFLAQFRLDGLKVHWHFLSAGFLVLAADEVAGLHETFHTAIDFSWVIPAAALVALVLLYFIPFLKRLEKRLMIGFMLAGMVYVGGALGIEMLAQDMDEDTMVYGFYTAVEEGMEMLGAWLFLTVSLQALQGNDVNVRFL